MDTRKCVKCEVAKPTGQFALARPSWCKNCTNFYQRLRSYRLTEGEFFGMLSAQKSRCGICMVALLPSTVVIDHNHDTGEVRGLLCSKCNTAIGLLNDDAQMAERAATYLIGRPPMTRPGARRRPNGAGSFYQRKDGKWVAAITVGGRRVFRYLNTKEEAERTLLTLRAGRAPSRTTPESSQQRRGFAAEYGRTGGTS